VPDRAIGLFPEWASGAVSLTLFAYFAASAVVRAVNYRRLNDVNERRRVRVLVAGFIAAVLASLPLFLAFAMPFLPRNSIRDPLLSVPVLALLMLVAIVGLPLSFAYSILRHRLFDVRIIIRQGVQYALARGVLLSVLPLLAVFLVGDLLIRDNQSLAATLKERGWIYFFLGIVTGIVYRKRQQWLNQIDRRFFRDRFDANCLLQEVIQDVKQAANLDAVSDTVLTRIQEALHPEFVSLVHHEGGERQFRSIASLPPLDAAALQVEGKLMGLVRVVGKPIQLSDSAWLADALPLNEAHLIDGRRIELVVPIQLSSDGAESLLVFGPKQSEEPYSREDQKLLSAIAASLASLSIKGENREPHTKSFGECPDCGACFNATEAHCHRDGSDLVRVYMTRLLSKRYRLEQRIGRGGMGTVYSGIDQELERPVAVKLIRPELLRNPDMIARFRKEARAAAGVVHRNVVTIYDFGVEEERPFIVMELLAGRTLRAELAAGKPLTPDRTLEILDGVCSAIKDAHLRQLLHRDLKPSNIFLAQTATGEVVKILDFGLVKVLAKSTLSTPGGASVIAGTPYYMAPELLMGEAASTASEMWALGVIAYEMLTGAHPFVTNTATAWQKDVLIGRFTPVHIHQLNVSPHLQAFFEQVFQLDPSRRIGSAQVFRSELECALKVPYTAGRQSNLAE
jgi:hypothetical protein